MASRRRAALAAPLLGACALAACSIPQVAPIPLAGPAPRSVLVLPVGGAAEGETAAVLGETLRDALRERGYAVIGAERAQPVLLAHGVDHRGSVDLAACGAAARELDADAFMALHVEEWNAQFAPALVRLAFDLGYRLYSSDGSVLWELRSREAWNSDSGTRIPEPDTELDSYLEPSQRGSAPLPYRTPSEAARAVHAAALRYLPVGAGT